MMTHANIKDLNRHIGEEVRLQGWAYRVRSSGKVAFLLVRDGTGLCHCVVEKKEETAYFFDTVKRLPQ